ncbi:type I restriction enzyme HsdR N-terminal domain-containing protein [Candidatus Deianiraea vastatrix]|uniref:Restriction endonuclease/methylase, N-terminal n=1 Tax=Candidatus Deianiraea vastatrix TaxID=2163644 RepID=A0A5B8XGK2_9RICK|nr:type I restriction enzyme HsdR N-terminal domain-containing protein [Candidatus Deianiraea vastatrix]QED23047.1 Putative restriction endonuclease/methylase, N-terminal [Candidatus Deianiraea vastatrix]
MVHKQEKQELLLTISSKIQKIATESQGFERSLEQNSPKGRNSKEDEEYLEANTENVLLKPFVEIFGYNTQSLTDPNRAVAQHKVNSRRVDLALFKNNQISIVIECKGFNFNLNNKQYINQLSEYFNNISPAPKFGILTNGLQYKFYASFDNNNRLDDNICFEFDIRTDSNNMEKLDRLYNILHEVDEETAKQAKTYSRTREFIEEDILNNPTDLFIRKGILETAKESGLILHEGKIITAKDTENLKPIVRKIFEDIIKERVQQGLIQAINSNNPQPTEQETKANKTEFTELEHQALLIIKAIASELESFDINRITADDCQGHCNIILDGQARNKKICVLYFNNTKKLSISINSSQSQNNTPYNLTSPSDIYKYKEELKESIRVFIQV